MELYSKVSALFKDKMDADGNIVHKAAPIDFFLGQAVTFFYQLIIIKFGNTYKSLATTITYNENHQYQRNYDDSFILKVFTFNFFNFYTPMIKIAFIKSLYNPIFVMLLTQQGFKQNWTNIKEYFIPIFKMKPKIDKLNEEFKETLDKYKSYSKTSVLDVKCEKGDPLSIRRY
jgi:hypothetical protein